MAKGIKLFRILGIQISIDYTWFLVFVLIAWSLGFGYFPFHYPGMGRFTYFFMGLVSSLLLFACVLIHELSHSYTANRLGLDIKEITLFIFGGLARLTREPEDAGVELRIALAGPVASAFLAALFFLASRAVPAASYPVASAVLKYLYMINIVLVVFNMIPGFPLDGGRVLRAIWWMKTGDIEKATVVASRIGKGFAILLIIMGFLQIATGNFVGGLWSVFIGVFLQQAAQSGYQQILIKKALEGVKVKDVMSKGAVTVDEETRLSQVVEDFFFRYHYASFPVLSGNRTVGILTLNGVRGVKKERWAETAVREVMQRLTPDDVLSPEDSALHALTMLAESPIGRFPVLDKAEIVGVLSRSDIMNMMEVRSALRR